MSWRPNFPTFSPSAPIPVFASTFWSTSSVDRDALHRMAGVLAPGGVVILLVPAGPSLYGPH